MPARIRIGISGITRSLKINEGRVLGEGPRRNGRALCYVLCKCRHGGATGDGGAATRPDGPKDPIGNQACVSTNERKVTGRQAGQDGTNKLPMRRDGCIP